MSVVGEIVAAPGTDGAFAPVVEVRGLRRQFGTREVLGAVDLTIAPGEFVSIIGKSGCGKSTLLRLIGGLDRPSAGTVRCDPSLNLVFQDARLVPWRNVWRNVTLGQKGPKTERRENARGVLAEVALSERIDDSPSTLSGGEAQRASFARALLSNPRVLLLDEPFGALDALTRIRMQALLGRLQHDHGFAALLVTHDVEEAILLSDRILVMRDGGFASQQIIPLPRPRHRADPDLLALKFALLAELGITDV
jgi:sulfonate transport system ATP-binding protein